MMQIFTFFNGKAYLFTLSSTQDNFDTIMPTFQAMLNSFSSTPSSHTNPTSNRITTASAIRFNVYENHTLGIKINYPTNWLKQDNFQFRAVEFDQRSANEPVGPYVPIPEVEVTVDNNTGTNAMSLKQFLKTQITLHLNDSTQQEVGSPALVTLGGNTQAYKVGWLLPNFGVGKELLDVYALKDGKSYTVRYGAAPSEFNTYLPIAQQMVKSFQFIP
jgi:hypothetical protein